MVTFSNSGVLEHQKRRCPEVDRSSIDATRMAQYQVSGNRGSQHRKIRELMNSRIHAFQNDGILESHKCRRPEVGNSDIYISLVTQYI